jgi:hypothetical protein
MKANTAGELLELSLGFKENARELFKKWVQLFAGVPDVTAFWSGYASGEAYHARLLEDLRRRLSPEQLVTHIENELAGETKRLLAFLQKEQDIETLDQAYHYANMIDNSEINPLFEVLLSIFEKDEKTIALIRLQLTEHIGKFTNNFPRRFSRPELRQAIKVQP